MAFPTRVLASVLALSLTFPAAGPATGQVRKPRPVAARKADPDPVADDDGFVATGPGNGVLTAQQLSEQRATTVRDALAEDGVPAGNIVTRGLGEGSSPAAQAAGRRVDVTVI